MAGHWATPIYNPGFAVAIIAGLAAVAWAVGRVVPFYRRELAIEDVTRLTPLDGLRGILCFAVMCCHGAQTYGYIDTSRWEGPWSRPYALMGSTSVGMFFCITAFLFWGRALSRGGELPPGPFLRGRFFRLVPLYLFADLLAIAIVGRHVRWSSPSVLPGLARLFSMGLVPWERLGTVEVWPVDAGVTWSLPYEWGFYLMLPALACVARGGRERLLWLLALGVGVMFGYGRAFFFLPGIVAAHAVRHPPTVRRLQERWASAGVLVALAALPLTTTNGFSPQALLLTGAAFVPIACGNDLFGILNVSGLRLMGMVSYSVYLLHGVSLFLARPELARARHGGGAWHYWTWVAGLALATLAASLLTYRWVEWPFIVYDRRFRRRAVDAPSTPTPAMTA